MTNSLDRSGAIGSFLSGGRLLIRPPNEETNKAWGINNAGAVGRDVMGLGLLAQTLYGHTIRCHAVEINGGQAELGGKVGNPRTAVPGIFPTFCAKRCRTMTPLHASHKLPDKFNDGQQHLE